MAINSGLSLDIIKQYLRLPNGSPSDTSRDLVLQLWLDGAIGMARLLTGRNLERAVYRDTFGYCAPEMYLQEWPIGEVLSVTRGGVELDPAEYQIFSASGRVQFKHRRYAYTRSGWYDDYNRLIIDYVGGYDTLPSFIQMAILSGIEAVNLTNMQLSTHGGIVKQQTVVDVGTISFATTTTNATLQNAMANALADYLVDLGSLGLGAPALHECERIADAPGSP